MKKARIGKLTAEWIIKGQNDLRTAEILLKEKGPTDTLCFHCHQAAEKFLKAYLVHKRVRFEKIHDLWKLAKLTGKKDLKNFEKELKSLNAYYIESRYLPETTVYTLSECKEIYASASKITQRVLSLIEKS